jgi:chromosome segregation ATPase
MLIDEVSFVDQGASPAAHISFYKADTTPFVPDDAANHIGDVDNAKRREWASFANAAYRSQLESGKSEAEAKRIAIQTANEQFEKGVSKMDLEDLQKRLSELETENKELSVMAKMSDAEKRYMDKMGDKDKERFMAMDAKGRKAEMDKAGMNKSYAPEEIEKQLDDIEKRLTEKDEVINKQSEAIEKMQSENEMLKLEKRAETELAGISGTVEQKAKLLKSLESIEDEDVRKMAFENMKAKANANQSFMKSQGSSAEGEADPTQALQKMAEEIAKADNVTVQQGFAKAMSSPEGARLYNESKKAK